MLPNSFGCKIPRPFLALLINDLYQSQHINLNTLKIIIKLIFYDKVSSPYFCECSFIFKYS